MKVTTFPYQTSKKKDEDYILQKLARASDLKASIASKTLPYLTSKRWSMKRLSPSAFEDFNLKLCKYM